MSNSSNITTCKDNISVVIAFLSQEGVAGIESRVPPVENGTSSLSQSSPNKKEKEGKDSVPGMGSHVFASHSESMVCVEEGVMSGEDRSVPVSLRCKHKQRADRTEEELPQTREGEEERVG